MSPRLFIYPALDKISNSACPFDYFFSLPVRGASSVMQNAGGSECTSQPCLKTQVVKYCSKSWVFGVFFIYPLHPSGLVLADNKRRNCHLPVALQALVQSKAILLQPIRLLARWLDVALAGWTLKTRVHFLRSAARMAMVNAAIAPKGNGASEPSAAAAP